jgi:hypothetical protein
MSWNERAARLRRTTGLDFIVAFVAVLACALIILGGPGLVPAHPMDQGFAYVDLSLSRKDGVWNFQYPQLQWSGGITASLTVGLYKLLVAPSTETLNWHVRMLGAAMYIGSAWLLVNSFVRAPAMRALAMLVTVTSGFQFLEPTSELIAASYLCLVLVGVKRAWPDGSVAVLLVLFGLCKVELVPAAAAAAAMWAASAGGAPQLRRRLAWTLGAAGMCLLPGLVVHGLGAVGGGRAMETFSQHYTALDPAATQRLKDVGGVREFASLHPAWYGEFLLRSALESAANALFALKGLLVVFAIAGIRCVRNDQAWRLFGIALVIALAPAMLVAFVHVRYLARFFPALVVLAFVCLESLEQSSGRRRLGLMATVATIGAQLWFAPALIADPQAY